MTTSRTRRAAGWRRSGGDLPNVAVEADVRLSSGNEASSAVSLGCLVAEDDGYGFGISGDSAAILALQRNGGTTLATDALPPTVWVTGATNRIRGECRGGFGDVRLTMFVNGTKVAEATEPNKGGSRAFMAIDLTVFSPADEVVVVHFDNASVIAIQPS
jgi:hypothetical protein